MTRQWRRMWMLLLLLAAIAVSGALGAAVGLHSFAWAGADALYGDSQGHPLQ